MALVDYSDSDSDSDAPAPSQRRPVALKPAPNPTSAPGVVATTNKKSVHKIVDSSKPGRIIVSLPSASSDLGPQEGSGDNENDGPPAKRARLGGARNSAFADFSSFLPAPKNLKSSSGSSNKSISNGNGSSLGGAPRPGVSLKTGGEAAFSRDVGGSGSGEELALSPPKNNNGPSIPADQKPADEVKLVGKPLMFRPLSVARRQTKKTANTAHKTSPGAVHVPSAKSVGGAAVRGEAGGEKSKVTEEKDKQPDKPVPISLFSLEPEDADPDPVGEAGAGTGAYEPMFPPNQDAYSSITGPYSSSDLSPPTHATADDQQQLQSLDSIADSIGLSARDRRALFGRTSGSNQPPLANVRNVNMDAEYAANQAALASGELQAVQHNPVRGIAPGKHSLRQLVNAVANQRDALEESFARGKSNQREAGARYGWK